jgi:hypothetical protein
VWAAAIRFVAYSRAHVARDDWVGAVELAEGAMALWEIRLADGDGTGVRGAPPFHGEVVRLPRAIRKRAIRKDATHCFSLLMYSAQGALRQAPGRVVYSPARARNLRTCGEHNAPVVHRRHSRRDALGIHSLSKIGLGVR